jgi:dipeptidyl aminopeptidase/acylaminoacyl peptidase
VYSIDPENLIVYGVSLGGSVAAHLVAQHVDTVKTLIIENTFRNLQSMLVLFEPVANLLFAPILYDRWDTRRAVDMIISSSHAKKPHILFIVGSLDPKIHPSQTISLFDHVKKKDYQFGLDLITFANGRHHCYKESDYHARLREAMAIV